MEPSDAGDPQADASLPNESIVPPARVECWRCGQMVDVAASRCPACAAVSTSTSVATETASATPTGDDSGPVIHTMICFAVLLTVSIVHGLINYGSGLAGAAEPSTEEILVQIGVFELISTIVVLFALATIPMNRLPRQPVLRRLSAWLVAWPLLAGLLVINFGYHRALITFFNMPMLENEFAGREDLLPWLLLLICVQPAIVEELFFRYLAINVMHASMGLGAVLTLSSLMFGMAHIGAPLSIPVLIVLGFCLGVVRIHSGSVLLPIAMHLVHNFVVIYSEVYEILP